MSEFAQRRQRLARRLGVGNAAIFVSGADALRNGDVEHPFRQQSTFYYLTGFEEPDAIALLRPGHEQPYVLFVRPFDPDTAIWVGPRAGVEGAMKRFGADEAYPIEEFETQLPALLSDVSTLWFSLGSHPAVDPIVTRLVAARRTAAQRGATAIEAIRDPEPLVDRLRLIKSNVELMALQRAVDITGAGLEAAMRATRPGMHEYQVQAILEGEYRRQGSPRDGFPTIAASGANACTLHYTTNRDVIEDGDLLLIDTGAEWDYYSGDVTRTFPASGRFSRAQRDVYDIVLEAQRKAIEQVAPGVAFHDVHAEAVRVLVQGLVDLHVLKGDVDGLIEQEKYRPFYMHSTSHWLGLDVHDAGSYRVNGQSIELRRGMVLTVEPGLYFAPGARGVPRRLQGIGIRIEDDIAVTARGRRNLSERIPAKPEDLEAIVGSD
jgi:Xaa-Pro aminopeptidase